MTHSTQSADAERDDAARDYFVAHEAQYGSKNLRSALDLYVTLIAAHPGTVEAGYSRSQIQNMVKSVVPHQAIVDAEVALILDHLPVPAVGGSVRCGPSS